MRDAQGMPTLATNCYEIERAMPYQPVIDLVTRALDARCPPRAARPGARVARRTRRPGSRGRRALSGPAAAVERFSRGAAGAPVACSGPAPRGIARRSSAHSHGGRHPVGRRRQRAGAALPRPPRRQRPVLVIYAYRDEELDSDERLARLVESLRRETDARRMPLARLGHADTESLVAALADANVDAPRAGRAPASRNRRQSVLPDVDPAVPERRRDASWNRRAAEARDCFRTRCVPPCACGSRTCPKRSGRCSKPPRSSAGASTSTPCST